MKNNSVQICEITVCHPEKIEKVKKAMPTNEKLTQLAELYKNFSDPTRMKILWVLQIEEMCVCDLANVLSMTISAISHQLKFLKNSNLIKCRKSGKSVYYSIADDHVNIMLSKGYEHINE